MNESKAVTISPVLIPFGRKSQCDPLGQHGYMGFYFTGINGLSYHRERKYHTCDSTNNVKTAKDFGELLIRLGEDFINIDPR